MVCVQRHISIRFIDLGCAIPCQFHLEKHTMVGSSSNRDQMNSEDIFVFAVMPLYCYPAAANMCLSTVVPE